MTEGKSGFQVPIHAVEQDGWPSLIHTVSMDAVVKIAILVLFPIIYGATTVAKPVLCNHATVGVVCVPGPGMTSTCDYEDSCISLPNPTAPVQILAY